jgi:hypothetical protein
MRPGRLFRGCVLCQPDVTVMMYALLAASELALERPTWPARASAQSPRLGSDVVRRGRRKCTGDCHGQRQALDLQAEARF